MGSMPGNKSPINPKPTLNPKDDEETRIFGIKKALISLLIKIISLQKKISTSYI